MKKRLTIEELAIAHDRMCGASIGLGECSCLVHWVTALQKELDEKELQIETLKKENAALSSDLAKVYKQDIRDIAKEQHLERLISEFPKKLLDAVNAEQLRCGHIAEAFWNTDDKLNADLRVKLTQDEKSMAYLISTSIRAMRYREENFIGKLQSEKRKDVKVCYKCKKNEVTENFAVCDDCYQDPIHG